MQLKGLVRFFAIALILICLYLIFYIIVRSHESNMDEKAGLWVKPIIQLPKQKYPDNKELRAAPTKIC